MIREATLQSGTFYRDGLDRLRPYGITSVDGLRRFRPPSVVAVSKSSDTFRVDADGSDTSVEGRHIYIKRYRYRGWRSYLQGFFRGTVLGKSRARLEFELLEEMGRRGVPVVVPITYVEQRRGGLLRFAALMTEGQANTQPLDAYFSRCQAGWDSTTRERFVRAIGKSVSQLHDAGVRHGGLSWRNILVAGSADDGWAFTYLDPSRSCRFFAGGAPQAARISDLSDFAASAIAHQWKPDFPHFFQSYHGDRESSEAEQSIAREVLKRAKKKSKHESHRIAVATMLDWLRRRTEQAATTGGDQRFDSVETFFAMLHQSDLGSGVARRWVMKFEIALDDKSPQVRSYTVEIAPGSVTVEEASNDSPDLTIKTDADAWLSLTNARPDALEAIRSGRLKLQGDTRPLALLVKWCDQSARCSGG